MSDQSIQTISYLEMNPMQEATSRNEFQGSQPRSYQAAGVDSRKEDSAIAPFLRRIRNTWAHRGHVQLDFGHFANIVELEGLSVAISTDGVGTKAMIAQLMDRYDTIGIDCVAVNVNDVLAVGAEPQSMVDYIAVQRVDSRMLDEIGKGLEEGARQAGITIVGGELAQIPEMLRGEVEGGGFDLAGTCVGTLTGRTPVTGASVRAGDVIIGLGSSGVHSNGLTLARRAFGVTADISAMERRRILDQHYPEIGGTLGEELLIPSRIYVALILAMLREGVDVRGLAHITGDGFLNLPRLEADVGYVIDALPEPPAIFQLIQSRASVAEAEMYEVFNMGIGFCVVVPEGDAGKALEVAAAHGVEASRIGYVVEDHDRTVEIAGARLRGWRGKGFQRIT